MRFTAALILCAARFAVAQNSTCTADNCLRAVEARTFPTRHGAADCSSFFDATITPPPVTVTATTVISSTTTLALSSTSVFGLGKREATPAPLLSADPPSIPTYASACSGTARYSSACSCIGVTPTTTTVPASTTTTTVTVETILTKCGSPQPTFILQLLHSGIVLNGAPIDGTYNNIDAGDGLIIGFNGGSAADAGALSLTPEGYIEIDEFAVFGITDQGQTQELLHFSSAADLVANGQIPAVCSIATGVLKCADGCNAAGLCQPYVNRLNLCPGFAITNDLYLQKGVPKGCVNPVLKVVPLCEP